MDIAVVHVEGGGVHVVEFGAWEDTVLVEIGTADDPAPAANDNESK
jgi:hypothetical protein